jgi:hypothetical protein
MKSATASRPQEFVCYSANKSVKLRLIVKPVGQVLDITPQNTDIWAYRLNGSGYGLVASRFCGKRKGFNPEAALGHFKDIMESG